MTVQHARSSDYPRSRQSKTHIEAGPGSEQCGMPPPVAR